MTAILHLMAAVLWNPEPRGDSYWVRLKHLTTKGIYKNLGKFMVWYLSLKAAKEVKNMRLTIEYLVDIEQRIAIKRQMLEKYQQLLYEYYDKYYPS